MILRVLIGTTPRMQWVTCYKSLAIQPNLMLLTHYDSKNSTILEISLSHQHHILMILVTRYLTMTKPMFDLNHCM